MKREGCSCCYDEMFDAKTAERQQRDLERKGPLRSTAALAEVLVAAGAEGRTVLDIGGGIGAVHRRLLESGARRAVDVDASGPYLAVAAEQAARRGYGDRLETLHGDFVELSASIEPADLVALDRVVCCYGDVDALVRAAAEHARRRLAIVVPRDSPVTTLVVGLGNLWLRVTRSAFRAYAHPHARIAAAARSGGLVPAGSRGLGIWQLLWFDRPILTAA